MNSECVVYTITDPRDYLVKYIGITTNPKNRFCKHRSDKQGKEGILKRNWILKIKKEGLEPIISIIDEGSVEYCQKAETAYIKLYMSFGGKLKNKAKNGFLFRHTKETKKKISDSKKGKPLTEKQREALKTRKPSHSWKGKKFTEQHLKNMSIARKGIPSKYKGVTKYPIELIKQIQSDYIPYVFGTIRLSKKYNLPTTTIERYLKINLGDEGIAWAQRKLEQIDKK